MGAIDDLLEASHQAKSYWETLANVAPETTEKLLKILESISSLENAAKAELRELGDGTQEIGGHKFRVSAGPVKQTFNIDDVLLEAEERNHLEALLDAGFLTYSVDAKQLDRLPEMLKVTYQDLMQEKRGTARVSLPKTLWKQ